MEAEAGPVLLKSVLAPRGDEAGATVVGTAKPVLVLRRGRRLERATHDEEDVGSNPLELACTRGQRALAPLDLPHHLRLVCQLPF